MCSVDGWPRCCAERLGGVGVAELAAVAAGDGLGPLARVHRAAVGRDGDDRVVGAEVEQLGRLDRRQHVARRREAEVGQRRDDVGGDALARRGSARPSSVFHSTSSSSVATSLIAHTTSVFITLWMSGMCLSPMPWMLCSP